MGDYSGKSPDVRSSKAAKVLDDSAFGGLEAKRCLFCGDQWDPYFPADHVCKYN